MRLDDNTKVYWEPKVGALNCTFESLFRNPIEIHPPFPASARTRNYWRLAVLPDDDIPAGFDSVTGHCPIPLETSATDGRHIDFEYHRIPASIQKIYIKQFRRLDIVDWIRERADSIAEDFDQHTVSVQIRSWTDDPVRRRLLFDINNYIREMEKFPSETMYFLSTDSDEVADYLQTRFPQRILLAERKVNRNGSRDHNLGVPEDLAELLALGRNKTLIGSYISTFTEVAWWLGRCEARVIIV